MKFWNNYNNWATSFNTTLNGQSGDYDAKDQQFTVGTYGATATNGTYYTYAMNAINCTNGINPTDNTRCVCPTGQVWFNGGCGALLCSNTSYTNYNGYNITDNNQSCSCNAGYVWDVTLLICKVNCDPTVTPNSNGTNFEYLSCECISYYRWDYTLSQCVPSCTPNCNTVVIN
jgi:hypothetical protein